VLMVYVIFAAYLYMLFKIILFKGYSMELLYMAEQLRASLDDPFRIANGIGRGNLVPFYEIRRALEAGTNRGYLNLYGNIAIFVPFGMLHAVLWNERSFVALAKSAFLLSLFLELLQAAFAIGTFDVDDILLNTFGAIAGYLAYTLYEGLRHLLKDNGTASRNRGLRETEQI
jgi:glycopeptide antibiotics resistance protein